MEQALLELIPQSPALAVLLYLTFKLLGELTALRQEISQVRSDFVEISKALIDKVE